MPIGDSLYKLSNNTPLTEEEKGELRLWGNRTQTNNDYVAGLQNGGSNAFINMVTANFGLSMETIQSKTLEADVAELTMEVPSIFKHLILMTSNRTSKTGAFFDEIFGQFNDDTGTNYIGNQIMLSASTLSGVVGTASAFFGITVSPTADTVAGSVGGAFMFFPNIQSGFWKYCLALQSSKQVGAGVDTSMLSMLQSFWWKSTDPIRKIRIFADTDNILQGSTFTLLGIK